MGEDVRDTGIGRRRSVAVDRDGNVFVAGWVRGPLEGSIGTGNAFVRKFDRAGNTLWTRQFGTFGGTAANDGVLSVASARVDADDNLLVLWHEEVLSGGDPVSYASYLAKWDGAGKEIWKRALTDSLGNPIREGALAVDGDGNVMVTGAVRTEAAGPAPDPGPGPVPPINMTVGCVRAYDKAGVEKWTSFEHTVIGGGLTVADESGNVFVAFGTIADDVDWVSKLDSTGKLLWRKRMPIELSKISDLTAAPDGQIVLVLFARAATNREAVIQRWNGAGDVVWELDGGGSIVGVDGKGEVIVVPEPSDAARRYDAARMEVWKKPLRADLTVMDLAFGSDGAMVLAGFTRANGKVDEVFVQRIKP